MAVVFLQSPNLTRVGSMTKGLVGKPDTTFAILDDDFMALAQGKANPQNLVMSVRIASVVIT